MADQCNNCGKPIAAGATNERRAYRLSRLFGRTEALCFDCWEARLRKRAVRQQRVLLLLTLCNFIFGIGMAVTGKVRTGAMFWGIGLAIFGGYVCDRLIHRTIRADIERLKERRR